MDEVLFLPNERERGRGEGAGRGTEGSAGSAAKGSPSPGRAPARLDLSHSGPIRARSARSRSGREGDRRDQPAVIRVAAVGGAAVAEEVVLVRVGAEAKIGDFADAGRREPRAYVAGQVEHRTAGAGVGAEEARVPGVRRKELAHEFGADLVGVRADRRPEHRDRALAPRAKALHGEKRRREDAGERAAPAGVAGADDAGLG